MFLDPPPPGRWIRCWAEPILPNVQFLVAILIFTFTHKTIHLFLTFVKYFNYQYVVRCTLAYLSKDLLYQSKATETSAFCGTSSCHPPFRSVHMITFLSLKFSFEIKYTDGTPIIAQTSSVVNHNFPLAHAWPCTWLLFARAMNVGRESGSLIRPLCTSVSCGELAYHSNSRFFSAVVLYLKYSTSRRDLSVQDHTV